jgi:hypothetical protein
MSRCEKIRSPWKHSQIESHIELGTEPLDVCDGTTGGFI